MALWPLPAGPNILLFYDDGVWLFPCVLRSQRGWAGQKVVWTTANGASNLISNTPAPAQCAHGERLYSFYMAKNRVFSLGRDRGTTSGHRTHLHPLQGRAAQQDPVTLLWHSEWGSQESRHPSTQWIPGLPCGNKGQTECPWTPGKSSMAPSQQASDSTHSCPVCADWCSDTERGRMSLSCFPLQLFSPSPLTQS